MNKNVFLPIYQQLELEFVELSYFVFLDKRQLKVYSIKIADLILRTVAEIENISRAVCSKEKIKFRDKNNRIRESVFFTEYMEKLNKIYSLENKLVEFIFENADNSIFDMKNTPFRKNKEVKIKSKSKLTYSWYDAYNKIKHDRVRNFKHANIENLILSLEALFLLNIYYRDEIFYTIENEGINEVINKINSFSKLFQCSYTMDTSFYLEEKYKFNESFFDSISYFRIAEQGSVYKISYNKEIKTDSDLGHDLMERLESMLRIKDEEGKYIKLYDNYQFSNQKTKCAVVAEIIKI